MISQEITSDVATVPNIERSSRVKNRLLLVFSLHRMSSTPWGSKTPPSLGGARVELEPPQQPLSLADAKHMEAKPPIDAQRITQLFQQFPDTPCMPYMPTLGWFWGSM